MANKNEPTTQTDAVLTLNRVCFDFNHNTGEITATVHFDSTIPKVTGNKASKTFNGKNAVEIMVEDVPDFPYWLKKDIDPNEVFK